MTETDNPTSIANFQKPLARVKSCASSGNIGPGFDIAGLALELYNQYEAFESPDGEYGTGFEGEFSGGIPSGPDNLVISSIRRAFLKYKDSIEAEKPLLIKGRINIPLRRGLGSSASAIVAGLLIANKVYGLNLTKKDLLNLGMEAEEHGDNIAAALSGGLAVLYEDNREYKFEKIIFKNNYRILLMIPGFEVDTRKARKIIPERIPVKDCVRNIANFYLLIKCLQEGRLDNAAIFMRDRLHQDYRKNLYPSSIELLNELNSIHRIPSAISGAGPSVMAVMDEEKFEYFKANRGSITGKYLGYRAVITSISNKGSRYY